MSVPRLSSAEIDERILDITAGLIARHGPRLTSMQAVADASGYSKAAIFARFRSKDRLVSAALDQCIALARAAASAVQAHPAGEDRDGAALQELWTCGTANPGFISLALAAVTNLYGTETHRHLSPMEEAMYAMFDDAPRSGRAREQRVLAVTGALSALGVLLLTYPRVTEDGRLAREAALHAARAALSRLPTT